MKIANPRRQGVQSLGRHSVGNTGFEGDADLFRVQGEVLSQLAFKQAGIMDKRQQQKADLRMQKEDHAFWEQWGGQEFFHVNELPSSVVTESMEIGGRVMSAEVLPMMYEDHMREQLEESSKMIDLPGSRTAWSTERERVGIGRLTTIQDRANKQIDAQILADQSINYQNAIDQRRPDVALQIAKTMEISDVEREKFVVGANQEYEIVQYEDMMSEIGREEDMKAASARLGLGPDEYAAADGHLDPTRKLAWKHKLDSELDRRTRSSSAVNKYHKAQLEHRIDQQEALAKAGYAIDYDVLTQLSNDIAAANLATDGDYEKERLALGDAILLGDSVNKINKMPERERWDYINKIRNSNDLPQLTRDTLVKGLVTANEKFSEGLNTDFMGTVAKSGAFGEQGLAPINFNAPPSVLSNQISIRAQQYAVAQQNYGTDLGGGMFTVEEAKMYGQQINSMSTQSQLAVISAANDSLGPASVELFQQLGKDGDAGTFSIAGIAQGAGYATSARTMLDGRKWRMTNGQSLDTLNSTLDARILKELGNVYINQPEKYKAVTNAVKDSYYGRRQNALDLTTQTIDGDDFDAAILAATGGTWEHASKKLPVPSYGMTQRDMNRWMEDTSWEHFQGNSPKDYPAETFWGDVQAGRLTLEPYEDAGTYTVSRGDQVLPSSQPDQFGRRIPYLLKYDASAGKSIGWVNRTVDMLNSIVE